MLGALIGFVIIGVIVGAGYLVIRLGLVPPNSGPVLNRTAFYVASPALLFTVIARAKVSVLFSHFLVVSALAAVVTAAVFLVVSRIWFRMPAAETALGTASSAYVNSNNIGLPVAVYVIGSAQYSAPVIMLQLVVFSPVILGVLDLTTRGTVRVRDVLLQPVRSPIVAGSVLGLVVALTRVHIPDVVYAPLDVLGGASVPLMLLAFGMSLRGQKPLAPGSGRRVVLIAVALKSVFMPLLAYVLAAWVFRLSGVELAAAVIMAALPTAQNMNNYAVRFGRAEILARDVVLLTTIAAIPVVLVAAALLRR